MSNSIRRNLRNSNTCPTIINPLLQDDPSRQLQSLVPTPIIDILKKMPQLSCSHLQALPVFTNALSIEQALEVMRRADDWQRKSMRTMDGSKEKVQESAKIMQILPVEEESKRSSERYGRQLYFDDQLHEFINSPHYEL